MNGLYDRAFRYANTVESKALANIVAELNPLPRIVKYGLSVNKVWHTFPFTTWLASIPEFDFPDFSSYRNRPYDWRYDL